MPTPRFLRRLLPVGALALATTVAGLSGAPSSPALADAGDPPGLTEAFRAFHTAFEADQERLREAGRFTLPVSSPRLADDGALTLDAEGRWLRGTQRDQNGALLRVIVLWKAANPGRDRVTIELRDGDGEPVHGYSGRTAHTTCLVALEKARLLANPDASAETIVALDPWDLVDVTEESGPYARVRTLAGDEGWIPTATLTRVATVGSVRTDPRHESRPLSPASLQELWGRPDDWSSGEEDGVKLRTYVWECADGRHRTYTFESTSSGWRLRDEAESKGICP